MRHLSVKAVLSSLLLLSFLFLAGSGAALYFGKTGLVWGIPRHALRSAHTLAAALMCVLAVVHVLLNRRLYLNELRALFRRGRDGVKTEAEREKRQ